MNRRKFFKMAAPAAATALVVPSLKADAPPVAQSGDHLSEMEVYRGFRLKWRGWFEPSNVDTICGQWIAYNPHITEGYGLSVYSSYPGDTRAFVGDEFFDTSPHPGQDSPRRDEPIEKLDGYKQTAKESLIKFIDEHYEELVDIPAPERLIAY